MATATKPLVSAKPDRRVLLIVQDRLALRIEHELEPKGCIVVVAGHEPLDSFPFDLVVVEEPLLASGEYLGLFATVRQRAPWARFVLLVNPGARADTEWLRRIGFDLALERPIRPEALPEVAHALLAELTRPGAVIPMPAPPEGPQRPAILEREMVFVLLTAEGRRKRGLRNGVISVLVHSLFVGFLILLPLWYTEVLDVGAFSSTWLEAPPPPPPPPPAPPKGAVRAQRIRPRFQTQTGQLIAPTEIPKEIAIISEKGKELDVYEGGVPGGVLGGVPGGVMGGVLGGVIGGVPGGVPLPAPKPTVQAPVRVGGRIREPRLIRRVEPDYPAIARNARIQGDVRIDAIIDTDGRIVEVKVLSGHPLLARPAAAAVSQWLYEPTYLNEQPIPVVLEVTVRFRLQ